MKRNTLTQEPSEAEEEEVSYAQAKRSHVFKSPYALNLFISASDQTEILCCFGSFETLLL